MITIAAGVIDNAARAQDAGATIGNALVVAIPDNTGIPLPNADKDAGIVASALARKNYNVLGVRNLDYSSLKAAFAEFKTRIKSSPSAPVFIYISGPAIQSAQDNYLLASDSSLGDIKAGAVSLNSVMSDLVRISSGPKLIVVDGARLPQPGSIPANLTTGLALPEHAANTIIMFNATPGLSVLESASSMNSFASAWSDAIINGAPSSQDLVDIVILHTFDMSQGRQVPWAIGKHDKAASLFAAKNVDVQNLIPLRTKMINEMNAAQGFAAALLRHSIANYEEYILVHIQNPMTQLTRRLLAPLRDATIWREAAIKPSTSSLWAYLKIYPRGQHVAEARAMLSQLGKPTVPPEDAPLIAFSTSAPTSDELTLLAQTIPYRLDETTLDLQMIANSIHALVPELAEQDRTQPKPNPAGSYFSLPLQSLDTIAMAKIQLPTQLPQPPAPQIVPDPKLVKKPAKPAIPVPPQRQTNEEPAEQPALITITIPLFGNASTNTSPAPSETPAPTVPSTPAPKSIAVKPPVKKPASDVFEKTFDAAPAQQALPY